MNSKSFNERISAGVPGMLMVLTVFQLITRSAYLTAPAFLPWLWVLSFAVITLMPMPGSLKTETRGRQIAGTGVVLLLLGAVWMPLIAPDPLLRTGERLSSAFAELGQLAAYFSGAQPALTDQLKQGGLHLIGGASVLLFLWIRPWIWRSSVLGLILVFGCFRWAQYVPHMEGALLGLALAWCFSAAMGTAPEETPPDTSSGLQRRLLAALLLAAGVFIGSGVLAFLFPLDSLNRWVGSRFPPQEWYRNEYAQHSRTDFLLENTLWYPLGTRLGGPVTLTKTPVMEVRSSRPGLHLRGMVKTVYTGQAWEAGALSLQPWAESSASPGTDPFGLTIHPFNSRELTLYAPLHTNSIVAENRKILAGNEELYRFGFQWFPDKQASYRVQGFLEIPGAAPLDPGHPYLQLPEISQALRELTEEITGPQGTDAQKMTRLMNWLRSEGTYRLDVTSPDPGREFVEQFVLGTREGYCTYFATALAVMGRTAGVPTRYVEGYILPEQTTARQTYLVTSDRAHAWVEAYIAGEGWVVYEPTPVYGAGNGGGAYAPELAETPEAKTVNRPLSETAAPEKDGSGIAGRLLAGGGIGLFIVILLTGFRVAWVERVWKKGMASPRAPLWELYGILSVLVLMMPDLKAYPTPAAQLRAAKSIFPSKAFESHDIIEDANRLLYGNAAGSFDGFRELLAEMWHTFRSRRGTAAYLAARYGTLALFNSYTPLIRYRKFRKEVPHGADQPHTSSQY